MVKNEDVIVIVNKMDYENVDINEVKDMIGDTPYELKLQC